MALLEYASPNTYQCAGSLINNRYVLTAAHCLAKKDKLTQVHLGKYSSNAHENCVDDECVHPTVTVGIDDVIIHENYTATTKFNDIALIRLSTIVYYTDFIKPICLPSTVGLIPNDATREISGWGRGAQSSGKQMIYIPRNNFTACAERMHRLSTTIHEETQICAGDIANRGACAGDSGGPLMAVSNNTYAIEGIISSGYDICEKDKNYSYPIIFTKVAAFESWIKRKILP
ncbi:CLIP domain-containing serine protease 2-like isoform X2 [Bradysia coprophila]|nr:CLIP domain-containing serine protease 2-like isoform X2 [Bradysia coprophila]